MRGRGRRSAPARAKATLNPGRLAAARVLLGVEEGAHAEDLLDQMAPPRGPDRGLAWHTVLGVLRRQGSLDASLEEHLKGKSVARLEPAVRTALRVGAHDLLLSRTPRHAAVSQAVELARKLGVGRASGLVNAVLRRTQSLPEDPFVDLPSWLAERWSGHEAWVRSLQQAPALCGVWRDKPVEELDAAVLSDPVGTFMLRAGQGTLTTLPGFAEGRWWVMDPAAVRTADLLAEALPSGVDVLDACAAPGGKSMRLASRGLSVTAVDLEPHRLDRLSENFARTGLSLARRESWDWTTGPNPSLGTFAGVLVDAPCTGLGTVRRHPEIKWRRQISDPAAMALRQRQILRSCAEHVQPGGFLAYAVCSPLEEEGRAVAESLTDWRILEALEGPSPSGDEDAFQGYLLTRA